MEKDCVRDRPVPAGTGYLRIVDEVAGIVLQPSVPASDVTGLGTAAAKDGYVLIGRTIFNAAGAGTYNTPANATLLIARALGAGGGGGGVALAGGTGAAGGGGGGEYSELAIVGPAASYPYAVGAGGAGGAAGAAGVAGGLTRLGAGGAPVLVAQGGPGAAGVAAPAVADGLVFGPGSGAAGGGYDFASGTPCGEPGVVLGGLAFVAGGRGAHTLYGAGGDSTANGPGVNATGPGGGGAGGSLIGAGGSAGGNGADGLLIIEEYA